MPYQIISSDYFFSEWYQFLSQSVVTEKTENEEYETLGTFSPNTNWEKVFTLGDNINRELKMTEQGVIGEVSNFRKRKNK